MIIFKFVLNKSLCPFARFGVILCISFGRARHNGFNACTQRVKTDGIKQFQRERTFLLQAERPAVVL